MGLISSSSSVAATVSVGNTDTELPEDSEISVDVPGGTANVSKPGMRWAYKITTTRGSTIDFEHGPPGPTDGQPIWQNRDGTMVTFKSYRAGIDQTSTVALLR